MGATVGPRDDGVSRHGAVYARAVTVEEMTFGSAGVDCAARLYRPSAAPGHGQPCVVMANGFTLTRDDGLPRFAALFARVGLAVLAFDFRCLGASGGEPRQRVDPARQRDDFRAAVSFARELDGIDPDSVAVWGFSGAAGPLISVAATDERLAAAVALCPVPDPIAFMLRIPLRNLLRLVVDTLRNALGRRAVRIAAVGPPGSYAVLTQPEALPGFEEICGDGSRWRNEFVPPSFVKAPYRPLTVAPEVHCPLLVCLGEQDRMAPRRPAERLARRAPRAELRRYPINHFGGFSGAGFEQVATDQAGFLCSHLLGLPAQNLAAIS
jgi:dienelactone hydrolase